MTATRQIVFRAPGPRAAAFQASDAFIRAIMGPVGSAKTSTCLTDLVGKAQKARPQADGWRRFKTIIIRDTYRNLEKTTIPSWLRWFPKDMAGGEFTGGEGGRPAKHTIRFDPGDGYPLEYIAEFIGLNDQRIEDALRGYEFTAAYLNEADLLGPDVLPYIITRIGRYPPTDANGNGASWSGIVLDFNAPDTENWVYKAFVEKPMPGSLFFRQPGGLEPGAENLANLPGGRLYYERMIASNPEWSVRRFVHNQFGYSRDGKPVYPEWNDTLHVANGPLLPMRGVPLIVGADAGLTPAGVVCQHMPGGQWRILDELVTPANSSVGPNRFGEMLNALLAEERYRAVMRERLTYLTDSNGRGTGQAIVGYADPSAMNGADKEGGEMNWIETVAAKSEIRIKPAPTNQLNTRIEAVRVPLTRLIDGQVPGLLLSPTCTTLRKGFNSGYRLRKVQLTGVERYEEKPEKNEFSHVHDALQYALLSGGEFLEVTGRREKRERALAERRAAPQEDYNPFNY